MFSRISTAARFLISELAGLPPSMTPQRIPRLECAWEPCRSCLGQNDRPEERDDGRRPEESGSEPTCLAMRCGEHDCVGRCSLARGIHVGIPKESHWSNSGCRAPDLPAYPRASAAPNRSPPRQKIDRPMRVVNHSRASEPTSELPVASSPGDHTHTANSPGSTATIPPPTPLFAGNPTR